MFGKVGLACVILLRLFNLKEDSDCHNFSSLPRKGTKEACQVRRSKKERKSGEQRRKENNERKMEDCTEKDKIFVNFQDRYFLSQKLKCSPQIILHINSFVATY